MDKRELTPKERPVALFWLLGGMLEVPHHNRLARRVAQALEIDFKAMLHAHAPIDCPNRPSMIQQFEQAALDLMLACPTLRDPLLASVAELRTQEALDG